MYYDTNASRELRAWLKFEQMERRQLILPRSALSNREQASMNLSEARVDLEGNLIAPGQIVYPADPAGHFPPRRHNHLRISPRQTSIRLVGAEVWPDADSGFTLVEEIPPAIFVPASLSLIIRNALEFQRTDSVHVALASPEGRLTSDKSESRSQPLSDWTLDINANQGELKVALSAALKGINPLAALRGREQNFWTSTDDKQAKLTVEFDVNIATRIAMFGTRLDGRELLEHAQSGLILPMADDENPSLANAPIALSGEIFGYDTGGDLIGIYESHHASPCIALTRCRLRKRHANGFLSVDQNPVWPRLWFYGFDMTRLIDVVRGHGKSASIELRDGWYGFIEWHREEGSVSIEHARIDLRLADRGFEFSYSAGGKPPENPRLPRLISGKFTIPWEILILRYPRLGRYNPRAKMLQSTKAGRTEP